MARPSPSRDEWLAYSMPNLCTIERTTVFRGAMPAHLAHHALFMRVARVDHSPLTHQSVSQSLSWWQGHSSRGRAAHARCQTEPLREWDSVPLQAGDGGDRTRSQRRGHAGMAGTPLPGVAACGGTTPGLGPRSGRGRELHVRRVEASPPLDAVASSDVTCSSGSSTVNVEPASGTLSARTRPPWASTIWRTMYRPSPSPP